AKCGCSVGNSRPSAPDAAAEGLFASYAATAALGWRGDAGGVTSCCGGGAGAGARPPLAVEISLGSGSSTGGGGDDIMYPPVAAAAPPMTTPPPITMPGVFGRGICAA